MFGITSIAAYTLAVTILILLPHPNALFCMAVAGRYGVRVARRAIAGTFAGMGALLKTHPALFDALKIAGRLHRAWLGLIFQRISLTHLNLMAPLASCITAFSQRHQKSDAAGQATVGGLFSSFAAKPWLASAT